MIDSLHNVCVTSELNIFILCLDYEVHDYFINNKCVRVINLIDLETFFPELLSVKNSRNYVEYIFTLSPFIPLYIFQNYSNINRITTLDADLYFLSDPSDIINKLGANFIGITRHSFSQYLNHLEKYGKYNVSFQSFPNSVNGLNLLTDWCKSCIEYCSDILDEEGRFADQKYLDYWSIKFDHVIDFEFPFVGLAPWNIVDAKLNWEGEYLYCKGNKIVFYHFHNVRFRSKYHFTTALQDYGYNSPSRPVCKLYQLYFSKIKKCGLMVDSSLVRGNNFGHSRILNLLRDLKNQLVFVNFSNFVFFVDLRFLINLFSKLK